MDCKNYYQYIDHTSLKAFTTMEDIRQLCMEAIKYQMASVCIPPSYVARIHNEFPDLTICTVIGFPLGYTDTSTKIEETKNAILDGALEIDMVINIADVKNGDFDKVYHEIKEIREASKSKVLKVIIETCYLTDEEKIRLCKIVTDARADFIKTSTGFGTGGATLSDVKLMKENIGPYVKIKAAGGVRSLADIKAFIEAGCSRIGTSSAIEILNGVTNNHEY
ncbi:MAG: deoxyribose-phosphate aldolase [Lachnospiraceae bacterium]